MWRIKTEYIFCSYQVGNIESICPDPEDPTASVNFKRAILSTIHTSVPYITQVYAPGRPTKHTYTSRDVSGY